MRKFLIEIGTGSDFHRPDPTRCAVRAVQNAIRHCTLVGINECDLVSNMQDMLVRIRIGVPFPEEVDTEEVLKVIPHGRREIEVVEGGLIEEGGLKKDGSRDSIIVAVAALTIMVP